MERGHAGWQAEAAAISSCWSISPPLILPARNSENKGLRQSNPKWSVDMPDGKRKRLQ